jgi:hypothetical protein
MIQRGLRIHEVEGRAGIQTKGIENLFNEIIAENFPNQKKYVDIQI